MRWWCPDGLSFGIAVAIGLAISTGYPAGFVAAIAMPVACLIPESRKAAFRNAVGYYSAGLWPMIPGAQRYLGQSSSLLVATLIWLCSSILLSLPWTLAWTQHSRLHYLWRVPLANLAAVVPPLALIGFISPVSGAGYLFPGLGWIGLAAATLLPGVVLSLSCRNAVVPRTLLHVALTAEIALGVGSHLLTSSHVELPAGWEAVNTNFGDLSEPDQEFAAMQSIQRRVAASSARVLVFPESVVPRWSDATNEFWRQTLAACRARGQVLAIGAGLTLTAPRSVKENADAELVKSYDFAAAIQALRVDNRQPHPPIGAGATPGALIESSPDSFENTLLILGLGIIHLLSAGSRAGRDVASFRQLRRSAPSERPRCNSSRRRARGRSDLLRADPRLPGSCVNVATTNHSGWHQQHVLVFRHTDSPVPGERRPFVGEVVSRSLPDRH